MRPLQGSRPFHPLALGWVDCLIHWEAVLKMGQHVKEAEGQVTLPTCTWEESHHQKEGRCPHS